MVQFSAVNTSALERTEAAFLTQSEQVLARCAIAREKLETGDYDSGCAALQTWWTLGEWPRQAGLSNSAAAELLLSLPALSVVGLQALRICREAENPQRHC